MIMVAALGIATILVAILAWVHPRLAVMGFLVLTFSNTPAILVHDHDLPSIGILIVPFLLILLTALTLFKREDPTAAYALVIPVLFYFVLTSAFVPWVADTAASFGFAAELAKNLVILLVLVGFLGSMDKCRLAVQTTALTLGGIAALTILQYLTKSFDSNFFGYATATFLQISGDLHDWRLSGPLPDPNFYAQLLVIAAPLAIAVAVVSRHKITRLLGAISALSIVAAILLTYSRGALLALLVVALAYLITLRSRTVFLWALFTSLAFVAPILMFSLPVEGIDRVYTGLKTGLLLLGTGDISGDPAVVDRISVMRAAIRMFVDNPLFGIGPGQFASQYPSYAIQFGLDPTAPAAPHSLYLEIAAEHGLLGVTLFAVLLVTVFKRSIAVYRGLQKQGQTAEAIIVKAVIFSLIGYLTTSAFLHDAFPRFFWAFMGIMIATWSLGQNPPLPAPRFISRRKTMNAAPSLNRVAFNALKKFAIPIVLVTVLGGGAVLIQTMLQPQVYSANATLLYRFGREYFPITPAEERRNWGENILVSLDNALTTEMHLLSSYALAAETLETGPEGGKTLSNGDGEQLSMTERVEQFNDGLSVRRVQGATMLSVEIRALDPTLADATLDTYLKTYQAQREILFHGDDLAYYEGQIQALDAKTVAVRAQIEEARAKSRSIESSMDVRGWSPDDPVPNAMSSKFVEAETELKNLDGWIAGLEYREKTLQASKSAMEEQRDEWQMSAVYTKEVSPYVKIADSRPAEAVKTGVPLAVRVLAAALGAAVLAWGGAIFWLIITWRRGTVTKN